MLLYLHGDGCCFGGVKVSKDKVFVPESAQLDAEDAPSPASRFFVRLQERARKAYVDWRGEPQDEFDEACWLSFKQGYLMRVSDSNWRREDGD